VRDTLTLRDGDPIQIVPEQRVDAAQFARVLAKIAYCQTIALFGLDGFTHPIIPRLILGEFKSIPYLVGSTTKLPPPPGPRGRQHRVDTFDLARALVVKIRLFADSGTSEHGMPIYTVVVGTPNALTKTDPN
jgi:hypothetical protein